MASSSRLSCLYRRHRLSNRLHPQTSRRLHRLRPSQSGHHQHRRRTTGRTQVWLAFSLVGAKTVSTLSETRAISVSLLASSSTAPTALLYSRLATLAPTTPSDKWGRTRTSNRTSSSNRTTISRSSRYRCTSDVRVMTIHGRMAYLAAVSFHSSSSSLLSSFFLFPLAFPLTALTFAGAISLLLFLHLAAISPFFSSQSPSSTF